MTRRSLADEHLARMVREVFAEMIDELPPLRPEVPSDGAARVDAQRSAARPTLRVIALAAACVVLVGGLAFVASRRGDDDSVATAPTASSSPDDSRLLAESAPWEDGVRMIVYVGAEASEESLQTVREALEGFSDIVDADDDTWRRQLDELAAAMTRWTGNDGRILEYSAAEVAAALDSGLDRVLTDIAEVGLVVFGDHRHLERRRGRPHDDEEVH